jgi:hypothetical protein
VTSSAELMATSTKRINCTVTFSGGWVDVTVPPTPSLSNPR